MDRTDWDERYRTDELIWRAEPNRFLASEVTGLDRGKALDLACGEGRNAIWLAEQGFEVDGVDYSRVALAKAEKQAVERGVEVRFVEADVLDWAPASTASYDLVVVMYLQLPADERRRALGVAARVLAPGGTLLVVGHDSTNLTDGVGGPRDPAVLFTPEDVVADLAEHGLSIERAERVRRPVDTDSGSRDAIDALVRARRASN